MGRFAVTIMLWVALLTRPAGAGVPDPLAEGVRAYRAGEYQPALEHFLAARIQHPDSGAVLFNLGLAQYQLRDFAAARRSFLELRTYPDMASVAEYHLGLVAARVGQMDRAASHLRSAAAGGSPQLRRLAHTALQMLGDRPVAQEPAAYLMLAAGMDNNRNRFADEVEVPGRDAESAYSEFVGALQYPLPWLEELDARANVFQRDYTTDDTLDQRSLVIGLRKTWRASPWSFTLGPEAEATRLEHLGTVSSMGLEFQAVRRAGARKFRVQYQPTRVRADTDLDYLEGTRQRLDVSQDLQYGGLLLTLGYDLEDNEQARRVLDDATGTHPPFRHGPYLRLSQAVTPRLRLDLNASYRQGEYPDVEQALVEEQRNDDMLYLGGTVRWRAGRAWGLRLDYRYTDNSSNLGLYDYHRHMLQAGLDWRY